jgi:hypothetical protein
MDAESFVTPVVVGLGMDFLKCSLNKCPPNCLPSGITTDFLIYSTIIPVMPFHLRDLGYSELSALVGYLLFTYVRPCRLFVNPSHWLFTT